MASYILGLSEKAIPTESAQRLCIPKNQMRIYAKIFGSFPSVYATNWSVLDYVCAYYTKQICHIKCPASVQEDCVRIFGTIYAVSLFCATGFCRAKILHQADLKRSETVQGGTFVSKKKLRRMLDPFLKIFASEPQNELRAITDTWMERDYTFWKALAFSRVDKTMPHLLPQKYVCASKDEDFTYWFRRLQRTLDLSMGTSGVVLFGLHPGPYVSDLFVSRNPRQLRILFDTIGSLAQKERTIVYNLLYTLRCVCQKKKVFEEIYQEFLGQSLVAQHFHSKEFSSLHEMVSEMAWKFQQAFVNLERRIRFLHTIQQCHLEASWEIFLSLDHLNFSHDLHYLQILTRNLQVSSDVIDSLCSLNPNHLFLDSYRPILSSNVLLRMHRLLEVFQQLACNPNAPGLLSHLWTLGLDKKELEFLQNKTLHVLEGQECFLLSFMGSFDPNQLYELYLIALTILGTIERCMTRQETSLFHPTHLKVLDRLEEQEVEDFFDYSCQIAQDLHQEEQFFDAQEFLGADVHSSQENLTFEMAPKHLETERVEHTKEKKKTRGLPHACETIETHTRLHERLPLDAPQEILWMRQKYWKIHKNLKKAGFTLMPHQTRGSHVKYIHAESGKSIVIPSGGKGHKMPARGIFSSLCDEARNILSNNL